MIILVHKNGKKLSKLLVNDKDLTGAYMEMSLNNIFENISLKHSKELLVWCEEEFYPNINYKKLGAIFHHELIMASYDLGKTMQFPDAIGYIEESPFINVPQEVVYPTWKMSTDIGGIYTSVFNLVKNYIDSSNSFFYFLNSIAKASQLNGLFCYSNPLLTKGEIMHESMGYSRDISISMLFKFVKQHYNPKWVYLLFFSFLIYEKKFMIFAIIQNLKFSKLVLPDSVFQEILVSSPKPGKIEATIDVLIPTINRKKSLYEFLKDLSAQSLLPKNVIIIEQDEVSERSNLDYLNNEKWPFQIKHLFIREKGACHARNLGLKLCNSEWVFFGDDDVRIEQNFLQDAILNLNKYGIMAAQFSCLRDGESNIFSQVTQSTIFGSGNSLVKLENIGKLQFSMAFEFGYAEDLDFGMELRKKGIDIVFFPKPKMKHLKLKTGGFRSHFNRPWSDEKIKPKPAPSVMLYKIKHLTREQILGYKNFYFLTNLKKMDFNIFKLQEAWGKSVFWSKKL